MGNFYTNVTVFDRDAESSAAILRELGRESYVVQQDGHSVVYDRECEMQESELLAALAERLATDLKTSAFAVLNHDDDVFWFQLYNGPDLVAEYANRGGPRTDIRALCRTLGRPGAALAVWWLLRRPFLFQLFRHRRLAGRLGLPPASVGCGFNNIRQGELPQGIADSDLVHVTS